MSVWGLFKAEEWESNTLLGGICLYGPAEVNLEFEYTNKLISIIISSYQFILV